MIAWRKAKEVLPPRQFNKCGIFHDLSDAVLVKVDEDGDIYYDVAVYNHASKRWQDNHFFAIYGVVEWRFIE